MVYLEWPLIQGLMGLSSYFLHKFGAHKPVPYTIPYRSFAVPIEHLFDNVATRNFDGSGCHYPIELLPTGVLNSENVNFTLPGWSNGHNDNVISNGQVLYNSFGNIREFHLLYAGDWIDGETGARFRFEFEDGTEQTVECSVKNWWNLHWINFGPIQLPYHLTPNGPSFNITQIHHWSSPVNSASRLRAIHLPESSSYNRLHIFAISLVKAVTYSKHLGETRSHIKGSKVPLLPLSVKDVKPTTRFVESGEKRGGSIVEVKISNLLAATRDSRFFYGFLDEVIQVALIGEDISTTVPGRIRRLMPGDDARLDIGIRRESSALSSSAVHVELRELSGTLLLKSETWIVQWLPERYEANKQSLDRHESPRWWRDAKFGIFIHWGVYSVPGWVPIGYYEEWYHWWIHNPAQPSNILWNYHRNKYGEDVIYDDFIPHFTGAKFNASRWIDLFVNAGAKYFVLVTKHHDGFALFDTGDSTHRSSVHLGPHRDFLDELMTAAKDRQPELKRGTYYSMPEWFNPAFVPYGFGNWPGGLARNAYDPTKWEPYTGHIEGKDYLKDIQEAHMQTLAERYETDIMWCDIGGPNRTAEFASKWYNDAREAGRAVTMNNRCGIAPDFDTPEYTRFSSVQTRSWETNEGIDPYSYGYNRQTKDEDYRSAKDIIHSLVDIVSKNGNYLLNLGPTGEGEIIPAMVERLNEVGEWLGHSGSCIYNTTYSFPGAEEHDLRFTTTTDTFCIISLKRPEPLLLNDDDRLVAQWETPQPIEQHKLRESGMAVVVVNRPLPVTMHDTAFLLGGSGRPLLTRWHHRQLHIFVSLNELDLVKHAWAFQIQYR